MLLGIVLHAAIPFVPYYGTEDRAGEILFGVFEYIHLWRMPLFFLISGFFTSLLWRRRGLRALLRHRLRRIGAPLLVFYVPVIVLVVLAIVAGYVIAGEDLDDAAAITDDYEAPEDSDDDTEVETDGDAFGFAHLWFLWHLLWLVAAFVVIAAGLEAWTRRRGRGPPGTVTLVVTWALPLASVVPFLAMEEDVLGPDTSDGLVPALPVIGFYAMFFFFGALLFRTADGPGPIDRLGRAWPVQLGASVPVFLLLAGDVMTGTPASLLEVYLAWSVAFGAIGLFRAHVAEPSYRVRWLSDASYWMYLMHLPLVFVFQGVVVALGVPTFVGFVLIVAATVALLVPSYQYLVRYTPIGTLLNGPRTQDADARLRVELEALSRSAR